MISSVLFSNSRGGILSLAIGLLVLFVPQAAHARRLLLLAGILLIVALGLLPLAWLGSNAVEHRLSTVWTGEAFQDDRLWIWSDVLPSVKDFPLFGTGCQTFRYVELMRRTRPYQADMGWDFAHNDYLEALIEGGVVRLALSLFLIALVYRMGWRALHRFQGTRVHGLVLGALVAFTTVVVHSFVDFGLHIQAIAVLATVLSAHLCALGSSVRPLRTTEAGGDYPGPLPQSSRGGRLGGAVAVVVACAVGGILCVEGWRLSRSYAFEVAARDYEGSADPDVQEARISLLNRAVRAAPEEAVLRLTVGQAYLDLYRARLATLERQEPVRDVERGRLARRYLLPALRHYLVARDLCPLMAKPHVRIADCREWLLQGDARSAYIRRAKLVLPGNAEVWYLVGLLELRDGRQDEARADWRRSLEISDEYLSVILQRTRTTMSDEELIQRVLPDRAATLLAAASALHPQEDAEKRRPFLEKARTILYADTGRLDAKDLRLRGEIEAWLGEDAAASASYEAALRHAPRETAWRIPVRPVAAQARPPQRSASGIAHCPEPASRRQRSAEPIGDDDARDRRGQVRIERLGQTHRR